MRTGVVQKLLMWLLRGKVFVGFLKLRSDVSFYRAPVSTFTMCKMYVMVVDTGVPDRRCHKTDDEHNLSHTPMPLYPHGQRSRYYWTESYVRPRADLDVLWRGNSWPSWEFSHNSWSSSPQPSHYTDYATPGTGKSFFPKLNNNSGPRV